MAPRVLGLTAPTVLDKVSPPVPASIVRVLPAPVIAPAKLISESLVNTVFAVRSTLPPPVCVIPPGAVIVPLPTVNTSELVTLRVFVALNVTVDPRSTVDPVIDKLPKLFTVPTPAKDTAPEDVTVRSCAPADVGLTAPPKTIEPEPVAIDDVPPRVTSPLDIEKFALPVSALPLVL